jgi:hypothetical protein
MCTLDHVVCARIRVLLSYSIELDNLHAGGYDSGFANDR